MINPRTAPYPVHRLMALKHEIKDSLSNEEYTALLNSDIVQKNNPINYVTLDHQLTSKLNLPIPPLKPTDDLMKSESLQFSKYKSGKWAIYVVGGMLVAVAIYVYYQYATAKDKIDQVNPGN